MTSDSEPTHPMRPVALRDDGGQLSRDEARHYANVIVNAPPDPERAGTVKLAWAFIRLDQHHERLERRVEALKLSPEDIETLQAYSTSRSFADDFSDLTEALVRLLTSQRED